MTDKPATSISAMVRQLEDMGIRDRHVMIHSSYRAIRPVQNGPQGVVDAMVEAVGDGVLLLPTYDFHAFTEQGYWSRQDSPSRMGVISETARKGKRKGRQFERTCHPMLSYAVRGDVTEPAHLEQDYTEVGCFPYMREVPDKRHGYLDDVPNSHGAGSVFDRLVKNDGLLLLIGGLDAGPFRPNDQGFTIVTHAACLAGAPFRFTKLFRGVYVDHGEAEIREYAASVCREGYVTEVTPAHRAMLEEGVIREFPFAHGSCLVASAREVVEWTIQACGERPELLVRKVYEDPPLSAAVKRRGEKCKTG